MGQPKILAFAGSTRNGSVNQKLVAVAVEGAKQAGAKVTTLDLAEYPLPLFNQDLETASPPESLARLHGIFLEHDGLLIASPEYNSSLTPLMKNTIDWVSRASGDVAALAAFQGKVAGLLAASPGGLGGLRGLVHLRSILQNIGVIVVPQQFALPTAFSAFDESGNLSDEKQRDIVFGISRAVVDLVSKING